MNALVAQPTSISHEFYLLKRVTLKRYRLRRCWTEICRPSKLDGRYTTPWYKEIPSPKDAETTALPHPYTSAGEDLFLTT